MPRGLKPVFFVHAIVALLFGIVAFGRPVFWLRWFGWTPFDPVLTRAYGAALLALALTSWLGYRAVAWAEVRIVVEAEIAFTVLSTVGGLWAVLFRNGPAFIWVGIVMWVLFGAAFVSAYARARTVAPGRPGAHAAAG